MAKQFSKANSTLQESLPAIPGWGDPKRLVFLFIALFIGLAFGAITTLRSNNEYSRFHEVGWSSKTVALGVIEKQLALAESKDSLHKMSNDSLHKLKFLLASKSEVEANRILEKPGMAELLIPEDFFIGNQDPDSLILNKPITATYYIPGTDSGAISQKVFLPVRKYRSYYTFFNKYPSFGLFILLMIIQIGFYSVLCTGFVIHFWRGAADRTYKNNIALPDNVRWGIGIGLFLLVGIIIYIITSGSGSALNPDRMFMRSLNLPMKVLNILGYMAAMLAMGGMLLAMLHLNQLVKRKEEINIDDLIQFRSEMNRRFETYFIFAAIILTLGIFTTGVFFNAINSLDFIRVITKAWGYSPMNPELVYFYGILNSLILVLVYLPCRYTMNNLNKKLITDRDKAVQNTDGAEEKKKSTLSPLLEGITKVLVVTSPFLASLLQSLLDLLFK